MIFLVERNIKINPHQHFLPQEIKIVNGFHAAELKGISKPRSVDFIAEWRNALTQNSYMSFLDWTQQLEIDNKQPQISVDESADIIHTLSLKSVEGGYKYIILWLPEKLNASAANKLLKSLEEPEPHTLFVLVSENYEHILSTISSRTQLVQVSRIAEKELTHVIEKNYELSLSRAKNISRLAEGNYNLAVKLALKDDALENSTEPFLAWMRLCYSLNYK